MKNQLFILIVLALFTLSACEQPEAVETTETTELPDYAAFDQKVEIMRSFFKAHEDENLEALRALLADTLRWGPPYYNGNEWLGKVDYVAVLQSYHNDYENIKFKEGLVAADTPGNGMWSGSVFPEDRASNSPDVIRIYGTWTAIHTASGKETGVKWFGLSWINDAGKISQFTEYFDVHGLAVQIAEE